MKRAFTLVEMAIVLVIVSFIVSMGIMGYAKMNLGEKYKLTKQQLEKSKKLVYIFAQMKGRFPCPDVDGDGEEDYNETAKMCLSEQLYKSGNVISYITSNKPGDIDYAAKENIPPYIFPYKSVGGIKNDAFTHPLRYDLNFLLGRTDNVKTLCDISAFLMYNRYIDKSASYQSGIAYDMLPIVTNDSLAKDNEIIDTYGTSVAGVIISEGENPGVSNINKNSNMEYAIDSKAIESEYLSSDNYDDISSAVDFNTFLDYACGGFKNHYYSLIIQNPKIRCLSYFDGTVWQPVEGSELESLFGGDDYSSFVFTFDLRTLNYLRIFENDDCTGNYYTLADVMVKKSQNSYPLEINSSEFNITNVNKTVLFTPSGIRYNETGCPEVGKSIITDENTPYTLYSDESCSAGSEIGVDLKNLSSYDKNGDGRVYLLPNGSGGYDVNDTNYDNINVYFEGPRSYMDANFKCIKVSDTSKQFDIKKFAVFFTNDSCEFNSDEFYFMDNLINADMFKTGEVNDGKVKINSSVENN